MAYNRNIASANFALELWVRRDATIQLSKIEWLEMLETLLRIFPDRTEGRKAGFNYHVLVALFGAKAANELAGSRQEKKILRDENAKLLEENAKLLEENAKLKQSPRPQSENASAQPENSSAQPPNTSTVPVPGADLVDQLATSQAEVVRLRAELDQVRAQVSTRSTSSANAAQDGGAQEKEKQEEDVRKLNKTLQTLQQLENESRQRLAELREEEAALDIRLEEGAREIEAHNRRRQESQSRRRGMEGTSAPMMKDADVDIIRDYERADVRLEHFITHHLPEHAADRGTLEQQVLLLVSVLGEWNTLSTDCETKIGILSAENEHLSMDVAEILEIGFNLLLMCETMLKHPAPNTEQLMIKAREQLTDAQKQQRKRRGVRLDDGEAKRRTAIDLTSPVSGVR
ncbi:hypothetical protein PRZ48_000252 [Zasmidium cellare]|uniref:Uncharacterized protein n=1 Tax=Zasmidium cellare TaxID=395010 RepID=A0ABR0EZN7_ZASCE|nr:hypothetical protein PRZ48_000252 [Zasmidium cellare]